MDINEYSFMCNVFKPYDCPALSVFGDDAIHFYLMFKAISQVTDNYIRFSEYTEDSDNKMPHLERTFAYELYRQWMNLIQNEPNYDLTLNAEIDKLIGVDEVSKATKKYPDIVLHRSQSKTELHQQFVCEIKRMTEDLKAEAVGDDLFKLCLFLDENIFHEFKFKFGIFILVNGKLCDIVNLLSQSPKITKRKRKERGEQKVETMEFCEFCRMYHDRFLHVICISYFDGVVSFDNLNNLLYCKI